MNTAIVESKKNRNKVEVYLKYFINKHNIIYSDAYYIKIICRIPKNIPKEDKFYLSEYTTKNVFLKTSKTKYNYTIRKNSMSEINQEYINKLLETEPISCVKCIICKTADSNNIFMPCGHMCTCTTCVESIEVCPLCNVSIATVVKSDKILAMRIRPEFANNDDSQNNEPQNLINSLETYEQIIFNNKTYYKNTLGCVCDENNNYVGMMDINAIGEIIFF